MPLTADMLPALEADLLARRLPYALATIVWRRQPASGKTGAKAIVTADGRLQGWVGGACAEPVVIREALDALRAGTPRLLHLGRPDELVSVGEGKVVVPISCASEGALEIFIEPHLPPPHLAIIGRAPLVPVLAEMARLIGFEVSILDPADAATAEHMASALDLRAASVGPTSFVVVATVGHYDEAALEAALATPAPYIALVASRRRAATVLDQLRQSGIPERRLAAIHAPAGHDLGPIAHEEIAVAILAEIVQLKARGVGMAQPASARPVEAIDPVCGMSVAIGTARYSLEHEGMLYYFCCPGCQGRFRKHPERFLETARAGSRNAR